MVFHQDTKSEAAHSMMRLTAQPLFHLSGRNVSRCRSCASLHIRAPNLYLRPDSTHYTFFFCFDLCR
jgi:hypothetical protein